MWVFVCFLNRLSKVKRPGRKNFSIAKLSNTLSCCYTALLIISFLINLANLTRSLSLLLS